MTRVRSVGLTLLSFSGAIVVWHLFSTYVINPHLIPPPLKVLEAAIPMVVSGELASHVVLSLARIAVGFITGSLLAVVAGVLMGRITLVNRVLEPIIEIMRYLSPTAMIPIAVIWFGIGENSKYFLIFWGAFFIVLINAIAGVMNVPVIRQRAAKCLGAPDIVIFLRVVIPSSVPYLVAGTRVALATSFYAIVPAEMLAADAGLGFLLQQSRLLAQTDRIFVALFTISIVGMASDKVFRLFIKKCLSRYTMHAAA